MKNEKSLRRCMRFAARNINRTQNDYQKYLEMYLPRYEKEDWYRHVYQKWERCKYYFESACMNFHRLLYLKALYEFTSSVTKERLSDLSQFLNHVMSVIKCRQILEPYCLWNVVARHNVKYEISRN